MGRGPGGGRVDATRSTWNWKLVLNQSTAAKQESNQKCTEDTSSIAMHDRTQLQHALSPNKRTVCANELSPLHGLWLIVCMHCSTHSGRVRVIWGLRRGWAEEGVEEGLRKVLAKGWGRCWRRCWRRVKEGSRRGWGRVEEGLRKVLAKGWGGFWRRVEEGVGEGLRKGWGGVGVISGLRKVLSWGRVGEGLREGWGHIRVEEGLRRG